MDEDASRLRISDADRHRVAEVLREAAGEGRLDLDELDERLEAAYAAKIYADLVPIVADLPGAGAGTPLLPADRESHSPVVNSRHRQSSSVPATRHSTSFVMMGGQDRNGIWEIAPTYTVVCVMGGIELDLREAVFGAPEVVINASCIMGGVDIVVNQWTRVVVDGFGIMGEFSELRPKVAAELGTDSPVVRIRGLALMGAVNVRRRPMPGEDEEERGRRRPLF